MSHLVIIDGAVGAGKSSVIERLTKKARCLIIPEYIENPDGVQRLNAYLSDKVHLAYAFQLYVLQHYRNYVDNASFKKRLNNADYVIMERDPLVGVLFFAKDDYENGFITNEEYANLINEAHDVVDHIKNVVGGSYNNIVKKYNTDNATVDELVDDILNTNNLNTYNKIVLVASPNVLYKRIHKRNRPGETDFYNRAYISNMYQRYYSLF